MSYALGFLLFFQRGRGRGGNHSMLIAQGFFYGAVTFL